MFINRETWLNLLAEMMRPRFKELGYDLPKFYVSIGFPGSGKDGNAAAECWSPVASADGAYQIFIRPDESDSMMIAGHLAHELTHAAVGFECSHKGAFATVVLALGLKRPLTSTVPGPAFEAYAQPLLDKIGPVPHARLQWRVSHFGGKGRGIAEGLIGEILRGGMSPAGSSNAKKKQSTRMLKCACQTCGYTVRVSKKWLDESGAPHCPLHGAMDCDSDCDSDGGE